MGISCAQAASAPGTGELLSVGRSQVLGLRVCLSALGRHSRLEEWEGLCFGFEGSDLFMEKSQKCKDRILQLLGSFRTF